VSGASGAADQHDPAEMTAGRGILQANFTTLQGIMTGDEKLTTSHPVTDCRNVLRKNL
jgi:hypothetical protein